MRTVNRAAGYGIFAFHLLDELDERGLKRKRIERVATDPEWMEPSRSRADVALRFGQIDEAGGKVLHVATIDENDTRVVITAHFDGGATRLERKTDATDL